MENEIPPIVVIQTKAYYYRGQIISDLIHLERLMDQCLVAHFCSELEKQKELFEVVLANERISFSNKIQIFEYIFKKHNEGFVKTNPNIFADIKNLNEERNIVAHYLLDTSETGLERLQTDGSIGFIKFRHGTENLWRGEVEYNRFHKLQVKCIKAIEDFMRGNNSPQ